LISEQKVDGSVELRTLNLLLREFRVADRTDKAATFVADTVSGGLSAMAEYRAYIVGPDGHFTRAIELDCRDDESAKEYAKQLVDSHDVAQADRKIGLFTARPVPPPK